MKKISKLVGIFCALISFTALGREKPVFPLSIEHIGKGNASLTTARDGKAIFFNPALISMVPDTFYLLDFGFGNSKVVNEIFQNPQVIEEKVNQMDAPFGYLAASGPLYLGFKYANFQMNLFHSFSMDFDTYAVLPPDPTPGAYGKVSVTDDFGIITGVSFLLPVQLVGSKWEYVYWGFSSKIFQRVFGENSRIPLSEISDMGNPLEFVSDKLSPGRAVSFTSDMGISYHYADFALGIVGYNLISLPLIYKPVKLPAIWKSSGSNEIRKTSLPVDFGVGMSYRIPQFSGVPTHLVKDVSFSMDFQDLLNSEDYPELTQKIRLGMETILAKVIFVRLGLYHGMMTFGIGYEIFCFKIDAAYWGEKIGDRSTLNWGMRIGVEF